jgi:hypothetical protein
MVMVGSEVGVGRMMVVRNSLIGVYVTVMAETSTLLIVAIVELVSTVALVAVSKMVAVIVLLRMASASSGWISKQSWLCRYSSSHW